MTLFLDEGAEYIKVLANACQFIESLNERIENVQPVLKINSDRDDIFILQSVNKFVKTLIKGIDTRFLKDFETEDNIEFIKELHILSPNEVKHIDPGTRNIKLRLFSKICDLNEVASVEELRKFGPTFNNYLNQRTVNPPDTTLNNVEQDPVPNSSADSSLNELPPQNIRKEWKDLQQFFAAANNRKEFGSVFKIYRFIYTLPCAQVDCERAFSAMKHIKTASRSLLSDDLFELCVTIKYSADLVPASSHADIIKIISNSSNKLRRLL